MDAPAAIAAMVTRHPTFPAVSRVSHEGREDLWISRAHYD